MRQIVIALVVFIVPCFVFAAPKPQLILSTNTPLQGDTVKVVLKNGTVAQATYKKKPVVFFPFKGDMVAFIPIAGTETSGAKQLKLELSDKSVATRTVWVKPRKFTKVSLGIPAGSNLTSATLIKNLAAEKQNISDITSKLTEMTHFDSFISPLEINRGISSPFGEIRKTGLSIVRHWGIDYKAGKGDVVHAISGGVVARSYFDSVYGNTIIIDHGRSVFSLYMHLDERKKQDGDSVGVGETIGTVGNTGYSFGPHLHLSVRVNDISVDPEEFMKLMK